ncbi:MAG: hypothetical protein KIT25_09600 [Enhydrobacter sp.]|nr:MAG: hypothetical protein KIT25_09600 [Enhydrobacter sp.]
MIRPSVILWTMIALAAAAIASPVEAQAPDPLGSWTGTMVRIGPNAGRFPVTMTLEKPTQGFVDYPSLGCGGTITGSGSGAKFTFTQKLTYGREKCVDGGTILFEVFGEQAYWEWSGGSGGRASARLQRSLGGPAETCDDCGKNLLKEVAAAMAQSEDPRLSVERALEKYDQCRLGLPNRCIDHCAYELRSALPRCGHRGLGPAYRICLDTSYAAGQAHCR